MNQQTNEQPPSVTMMQMVLGGWAAQTVSVAAKLGVADCLERGPQSVDELAAQTSTHAPSLFRILRALASNGVFARDEDGRYRNTALSESLRSAAPDSVRAAAIMMGEEHHKSWGHLLHSVKTGQTAFDDLFGENWFEYVAKNPEASETFNNAMTNFARQTHGAAVRAYDFSDLKVLCDVGGGHGALLSMVLETNPQLRGVLFDLPHVVAGAHEAIAARGLQERVEICGGDFFSQVPHADAHIMSHIVHDWDDERAIKILQSCRNAVNENGKVLLVEMVVPEGDEPAMGKWMDLNMLVMTPGGRERTQSEYSALLASAGYKLNRIVPTQAPVSVVEGVAV